MSVNAKMTAIADAIRDKTGSAEKLSLDEMAAGVGAVYTAGQQDRESAFWDAIQDSGNRTDYRYAFFHTGFTHIDPKWDIRATNGDSIFCVCAKLESVNWEKVDLSAASSLYSAFAYCSNLTEVDTDLCVPNGTATLLNSVFRNCTALQRVKKITAHPSAVWKNSFDNCTALTHIIFDGTIGANGLNLQWSTELDRESIESIINALSDTTTGLCITLSEAAVINAFGSLYDEWTTVAGAKLNWTINLV